MSDARRKKLAQLPHDMLCDMREDSEIRVDGELFYRNGAFEV